MGVRHIVYTAKAYDGRGMMTEVPTAPDFLVRFFLNITKVGSLAAL